MIVGLAGKKLAGKNTVAKRMKIICDEKGIIFVEGAFADLLKKLLAESLGCTVEDIENWKETMEIHVVNSAGVTVHHLTARQLYQNFGTEAMRHNVNDRFWIDMLFDLFYTQEINYFKTPLHHSIFMITDVRFGNEVDAIHGQNGEMWSVLGPQHTLIEDTHVSEAGLPNAVMNHVIQNQIRDDGFRLLDGQLEGIIQSSIDED